MTHFRLHARGFTLLEVLIAIVIMSIGVFGLASLQITAKRNNFEAVQQATATFLVQELLERMRANPSALTTYTSDGVGRTLTGSSLTATTCNAGCAPTQMALFDLYEDDKISYEDALRNADSMNELRLRIKLEGKAAKQSDKMEGLDHLALEETEQESGMLR